MGKKAHLVADDEIRWQLQQLVLFHKDLLVGLEVLLRLPVELRHQDEEVHLQFP